MELEVQCISAFGVFIQLADSVFVSCADVIKRIAGGVQEAAVRTLQYPLSPLAVYSAAAQPVVVPCFHDRGHVDGWHHRRESRPDKDEANREHHCKEWITHCRN